MYDKKIIKKQKQVHKKRFLLISLTTPDLTLLHPIGEG